MNSHAALAPRLVSSLPCLHVTAEDMARLRTVVERYLEGSRAVAAEQLELELDRAVVVPQNEIPSDVVTMRSRILFEDLETGRLREATLAYPDEANMDEARILDPGAGRAGGAGAAGE